MVYIYIYIFVYIELNKQFTIDEINIDKPNLNKYFSNIEICLSLLEGEICLSLLEGHSAINQLNYTQKSEDLI